MLLIQQFAKLCGCSTSILRYYDNKDVLKPYYVESFTGYRYYLSKQALEFHRIKQLQEAGLSIKEIKKVKNESEIEIINLLQKKLIEQKQLANTIENLIKTYQIRKMKVEENIKEANALYTMKVSHQKNELFLEKNGEILSLKFLKDASDISKLLHHMQEQNLIGFEDFNDLKNYQNETWNYTKVVTGWKTKKELLNEIEATKISKKICIHLFNIDETINLFDVDEIIQTVKTKGFLSDESFFNLSLSTKHINSYAVLYIDK